METKRPYRFILSGGGTGGHIYPAIAVANVIRSRYPDAIILFVGARGKMEMRKVPEAGYTIEGLWISGLYRRFTLENVLFPLKVISSIIRAGKIIRKFKPDAAAGFGGYASGPVVRAAARSGIPTLIQEQNSYAGLTNRLLAKKVEKICVAHEGMEKYFPSEKIVVTGNPVRKDLKNIEEHKEKALDRFSLNGEEKVLLVLGGSLGARTINESIIRNIDTIIDSGVHLIWQTGALYHNEMRDRLFGKDLRRIKLLDFISEMHLAYAAADLVISRAGAIAISELCITGKPVIFVPSPNVAEDHQTRNAVSLVERESARVVKDSEAVKILVDEAIELINDTESLQKLSVNIQKMAKPNAAENIVNELTEMIA